MILKPDLLKKINEKTLPNYILQRLEFIKENKKVRKQENKEKKERKKENKNSTKK